MMMARMAIGAKSSPMRARTVCTATTMPLVDSCVPLAAMISGTIMVRPIRSRMLDRKEPRTTRTRCRAGASRMTSVIAPDHLPRRLRQRGTCLGSCRRPVTCAAADSSRSACRPRRRISPKAWERVSRPPTRRVRFQPKSSRTHDLPSLRQLDQASARTWSLERWALAMWTREPPRRKPRRSTPPKVRRCGSQARTTTELCAHACAKPASLARMNRSLSSPPQKANSSRNGPSIGARASRTLRVMSTL